MTTIEEYRERFGEDPGYLDFARIGPPGLAVQEETKAQQVLFGRARFGSLASLDAEDERVRTAIAAVTRFRPEQITFQPSTSQGLMHAFFGVTGGVALSPAEFPGLTFAAVRSNQALGAAHPVWLETDHGRVTPGNLRDQLDASVHAVAVSLVDYQTGYLVDLEGIRQVIGDRLLIVDAVQGFGIVDAPYEVADVVVSGGQKWVRAGVGTGFLALSDRAVDALTPVFSGYTGTEDDPLDSVPPPAYGASAFTMSRPDPIAEARLAAALEEITEVGVPAINRAIADRVTEVIDLADEFAIPVVSPRDEAERAGIVALQPEPDQLTTLTASLFNHGVTTTLRRGCVRLAPHVSTDQETLDMLRASFVSFASAIRL